MFMGETFGKTGDFHCGMSGTFFFGWERSETSKGHGSNATFESFNCSLAGQTANNGGLPSKKCLLRWHGAW